MTNTTAPAMFPAQKIDGSGSVHIAKPGRIGTVTTFCTGRSVGWMVGTDSPVTCASCLKRAAKNGIDVKEIEA